MKKGVRDLDMVNGALLIFFLFQIAKTPFTACQNLITE